MLEQLAVPLAVLLLVLLLIWGLIHFARRYEREKIKRDLAELAKKLGEEAVDAHEEAIKDGQGKWL